MVPIGWISLPGKAGHPKPSYCLYPQYLGSMLIKDLRGTESTQDACAKMRVGCLGACWWGGFSGDGRHQRGTCCSPWALPRYVRSGGGWGLWDPRGLA